MKHIPNIFTLLNLVFGCVAIMYILQPGLVPQYVVGEGGAASPYLSESTGMQYVNIPEQMQLASLFIGLAAAVDFIDGFVARLFKATSQMGKQLDSLADVVSFGVAPGMILLQFLRLAYAQQPDGLDAAIIWLIPAFILPAAAAYRLARFNIAPGGQGFIGVPTPAVGLMVASLPLIAFFEPGGLVAPLHTAFLHLLSSPWFLYALIIILSWLMVSSLHIMAFKFENFSLTYNWPKYIFLTAAVVAALILGWLAVPVVFVLYVVLSLLTKQKAA